MKSYRADSSRPLSARRSPRGERGLKYIYSIRTHAREEASLPSRGAWIEISSEELPWRRTTGRSPRGERGLKSAGVPAGLPRHVSLPSRGAWIEILTDALGKNELEVAPLAGSVD